MESTTVQRPRLLHECPGCGARTLRQINGLCPRCAEGPLDKFPPSRRREIQRLRENPPVQVRLDRQARFLRRFYVSPRVRDRLELPNATYYLTPQGIAQHLDLPYMVVLRHLHLADETNGHEGLRHRRAGRRYFIAERDFIAWLRKYVGGDHDD